MSRVFSFLNKYKWIIAAVCAVLLLAGITILAKELWNPGREEVKAGVQYLKELESKDINSVEADVKAVKKQSQIDAIEAGELSLWAQFSDYVIFGDSRTVGFSYHEFLDSQRVIADGGYTIADIATYEDRIVALNPSYLFLCTGLNDVSIGYWNTPEEYVTAYEEVVQELMSKLPDTDIYINSIFPAQDPAFERSSKWLEIPDYNAALKEWCEEKGYHYIDNTQVYEEHRDLYESDGIHFRKDFYQYWAMNILAEVDE
ncbi:hypothetical protein I6E09_02830 [Mediterraneibacter glycyrrhizinilyticus]|uniref:SGNH/GDSL hydrolase family protein n=1 Tax=Mediterraneibacter glycyrrhizinilyticus TaxID=342942 RepID=UPI00265B607B|nr:GDSL-type esterase/lipase family protein [Mediterraneibacter glycyrrhizinilyticus]MCF2568122.1 hypothetical protein [Mediterraneibacter glycyrrhizinilyticus]